MLSTVDDQDWADDGPELKYHGSNFKRHTQILQDALLYYAQVLYVSEWHGNCHELNHAKLWAAGKCSRVFLHTTLPNNPHKPHAAGNGAKNFEYAC